MSGENVFVDESKRDVYVVVAAVIGPHDLAAVRAVVRSTQLPGTRRVHFQTESEPFRRKFLAMVAEQQVTARIYLASARRDLDARRVILVRLVEDLVAMGASRLVLERDDSLVVHDERTIKQARSVARAADTLRFDHLRGVEEPLLWLPDALAWAWCRDRMWRALVRPMVSDVTEL